MKKFPITLLCCLSWMGTSIHAAEGADARLCNLQGREIALRISEEVSEDLSASGRNRIAAIAEAVCLDYAGDTGDSAANVAPAAQDLPVASRPATDNTEEGDEEGGLFNLRFIDPEDRVQRPGLKRR